MRIKFYLLSFMIGCISFCASAQLRSVAWSPLKIVTLGENNDDNDLTQFASFVPNHYQMASPKMTQSSTSAGNRRGNMYWASKVTTQSYGKGKWGTLYYWDVQGNLREMKGFIDIAGKNKRGLKLVFPWN